MGKVAAIQMNSGDVVADNLAAAGRLLREARSQGADLACLPENFAFMGRRDADKLAVAEPDGSGPVQDFLSATARELSLWILGGTINIRCPGEARVSNSSLLFDAQGRCTARYDKIHLFDVDLPTGESLRESHAYEGGTNAVLAETALGPIGLTICYDMRFPGLYRALARAGAKLFAVPSAFTVPTGQAHWHVLLRARAIETGSFVLAAAQGGRHETGRETYGHSLIASPWGEVLAEAGTEPGVTMAEIDLAAADQARARIPALIHEQGAGVEILKPFSAVATSVP